MTGATLTPAVAALWLFGTFFFLMILRVPVAFALGLAVEPGVDFVLDARTVRLLRRALAYKDVGSVRIKSGGDVLTAAYGKLIFASVAERGWESASPLTSELIAELEHEGGSLASILVES
jgi:hypothetical protein